MKKLLSGVKEPLLGFSIFLSALFCIWSINSDVLVQDRSQYVPYRRLFNWNPPPIHLSSLLAPDPQSPGDANGPAKEKPLYVFVLDVSKSMAEQVISDQEWKQYAENLAKGWGDHPPPPCFQPKPQGPLSTFNIARAELCRYIDSVPDNNNVAIWKFGDGAKMMVPQENAQGKKYLEFKPTEGGGHTRTEPLAAVTSLEATDGNTDFDQLLNVLSERYGQEMNNNTEVHFVIVSDFKHDIGGDQYMKEMFGDGKTSLEGFRWMSMYRASASRIAEQLQALAKKSNTTFHLARIQATGRTVCSILPIINDTMEMYSYRETQVMSRLAGKEFDFLRSYSNSGGAVDFFYTQGGSQSLPTEILIDDERFEKTEIRLTLASEVQNLEGIPLKIKTRLRTSGRRLPGDIIRMNNGVTGTIERKDDTLTLEALPALQSREAATYRLLISVKSPAGAADYAAREFKTFAVPLRFYRQLDFVSAAVMLSLELLATVCLLWSVCRFVRNTRIGNLPEPAISANTDGPQNEERHGRFRPQAVTMRSGRGAPRRFYRWSRRRRTPGIGRREA
ncbi:MAG: hypothetical protein ACJ754_21190 [Pyrinomonadaceae bacterium]